MLAYATGFGLSVIVSSLLTWAVRNRACHYGLAHAPQSNRHIHMAPIPRLGGLAIFAGFMAVFLLYSVLASRGVAAPLSNGDIGRILILATGVFLIGLIDDLMGVKAWLKLCVEVAGGIGLYFSGIRFDFCATHLASSNTSVICFGATVGWVVLICNAVNLIDGVDGLAAGTALFSMVTIFSVAVGVRPGVANSVVILAGSLFGFLIFNFNPASIFMGDSGSLFVGFLLSAFVLSEQPRHNANFSGLLVPLVCFALPLTDVILSVLRRFLNGHSLFGADKEHIHHKLLALGLTQRQVVAILYGVSAVFSILSLCLLNPSPASILPVAGVLLLTIFFGVKKLHYHEFIEVLRPRSIPLLKRRRLATNIAIRKAAAGLKMIRDPQTIATLLEGCLGQEFDGFAVIFSSEFLGPDRQTPQWLSRPLGAHWRYSEVRLNIQLDLNTIEGEQIGQLHLYHDGETPVLARIELIRTVLRPSLVQGLQNALDYSFSTVPSTFKDSLQPLDRVQV